MPELRGIRAVVQFFRQSAEPCAAPATSSFTAFLMDPRAVKAQARFPRCSSENNVAMWDRVDDTLYCRARFFRSDAEDDESSIVSLQARFSERLFLRSALRLLI